MSFRLSTRVSTSHLMTLFKNDVTLFKESLTDITEITEIIRNLCWAGSYDIIKYIIQTYPDIDIHRKNENAFKGACLGDHHNIEIAKLLLEHFPHINIHIDNDYIFKTACERNLLSVIELYINHCPYMSSYEDLNTGYLMAFKYNHRILINRLYNTYPSLLETNYLESLYTACKSNHFELIKWLLVSYHFDDIIIDYNLIFSMELNDDIFVWLYEEGYYDFLSLSSRKTILYNFIKKNHIGICRTILNDHKELIDDVLELGMKSSYDVSYTIYKILDMQYLNTDLCTQAIKYCLKNNLIDDCRILMDQPNTVTKLDVKRLCYEGGNSQTIKRDYYEIVELMASKNEIFKKMYFETLSSNLQKCYPIDDVSSFIFYANKYVDLNMYTCFIEACRHNSLAIVQCLCRLPILGNFRIPQDISQLIIAVAFKDSHQDILQYLYTNYSDYSNIISKDMKLAYYSNKKLSSNMIGNLMWLMIRYPSHKMRFQAFIQERGPQFKIHDQSSDVHCMICKISHDEIIKLPCGHYICFYQMCHFRVEAGVHNICLACRNSYSWTKCILYNGKKSKLFPFL